jgi:hypothetical protein
MALWRYLKIIGFWVLFSDGNSPHDGKGIYDQRKELKAFVPTDGGLGRVRTCIYGLVMMGRMIFNNGSARWEHDEKTGIFIERGKIVSTSNKLFCEF